MNYKRDLLKKKAFVAATTRCPANMQQFYILGFIMTQSMAGNHHFSIPVCMAHVDQDPSHTCHSHDPGGSPLRLPQAPHLPSPSPCSSCLRPAGCPFFQLVPAPRQQTGLLLGLVVPLGHPHIALILPLQSFATITMPKARNAHYAINPRSRGAVGDLVAPCTGQLCPCLAASGTVPAVSDGRNVCHR